MNINFEITLKTEEHELVKSIFKCTEEQVGEKLNNLSNAGAEEYIKMILGQKVFTRGQDMKEYRLYLLIKHFFEGRIPDEQTVTTLFQTTTSESKALLKSVLAKYQYELKQEINNTIKNALENHVEYDKDKDLFYSSSLTMNIVDEINRILGSLNGELHQVSKKRNTLQIYEITASSYEKLCEHFEIAGVGIDE